MTRVKILEVVEKGEDYYAVRVKYLRIDQNGITVWYWPFTKVYLTRPLSP